MAQSEWPRAERARAHTLALAAGALVPVVAAALLGQRATLPNLAPWYASLAKPSFNPPNAIFGPVWGALYASMVYAAWRILRHAPAGRERRGAITLFYAQLTLNAAWSWGFFGLHRPLLGLVDIVPQWILIVATIARFWRLDRRAGASLVPLALWVAFAAVLNFAIWRLNP